MNKGKEAVLKRSRLLTEFMWTPLRDITVFTLKDGKTKLPAGKEVKGMLYSSTEPTDKFVTENISFETFRTIVNNPDSALYTKDIGGHNNSWAYFGIVCNGLARYALNIHRRYSTKRWLEIPGMREIYKPSDYTVEQMEVCDILYAYGNGRNHVALVSDLIYNDSGKVTHVEVSEAIRPSCARRLFTADEYYEKYKLFGICRYDYIDTVPEPSEEDVRFFEKDSVSVNPVIALDYGNKTNYRTYDDVVISVFPEGDNTIEIYCGSKLNERVTVSGRGNIVRKFAAGYYTVKHLPTGETAEFCVTDPLISHTFENGVITVKVNPNDTQSKISHMDFRETVNEKMKDHENKAVKVYSPDCSALACITELTDEEKENGIITRNVPQDAGFFKISFVNKYGIWTHKMIKI